MADPILAEVRTIPDPNVRAIAQYVASVIQLSADKAAMQRGEPQRYGAPPEGSLESILGNYFSTLPAHRQKAAIARTKDRIEKRVQRNEPIVRSPHLPAAVQKEALRPNASVAKAANEHFKRARPVQVRRQDLETLARRPELLSSDDNIPVLVEPILVHQAVDAVRCRIHSVKCIDETGGWESEWTGKDEIYMAGTGIDETGDVKQIDSFYVDSFNDGDLKDYDAKKLVAFGLTEGNVWPKSYFATIVLAEKDLGGFGTFLTKLTNETKDEVAAAVAIAVGDGTVPFVGPLAPVLALAASYVVMEAIGWLQIAWSDDIFKPKVVSISISSYDQRWGDNRTDSPNVDLYFVRHNGEYRVRCDWQLYHT
jgi:hypothetical protein